MGAPREECPICLDDLNPENSIIGCWNDHKVCETCFRKQFQPTMGEGLHFGRPADPRCSICRQDLIPWFGKQGGGSGEFNAQTRPPAHRRNSHRRREGSTRRCGVCRQTGHDRRNCPQGQGVAQITHNAQEFIADAPPGLALAQNPNNQPLLDQVLLASRRVRELSESHRLDNEWFRITGLNIHHHPRPPHWRPRGWQ